MSDETPTLFSALLAAQGEFETLPKLGRNDHGGFNYTSADAVVRAARALLFRHGLIWTRTGARLKAPVLAPGRIGDNRSHVGHVEITGYIWHASDKMDVCAECPIVAMSATPHDKAWAASVTLGTGYLLLGVLNGDRDEEDKINGRKDEQEPLCVGKLAPLAESNKNRCEEIAGLDGQPRDVVWAWACKKCEIPLDDGHYPGPKQLYEAEGRRMSAVLLEQLERRRGPGDESDQRQPDSMNRSDG